VAEVESGLVGTTRSWMTLASLCGGTGAGVSFWEVAGAASSSGIEDRMDCKKVACRMTVQDRECLDTPGGYCHSTNLVELHVATEQGARRNGSMPRRG